MPYSCFARCIKFSSAVVALTMSIVIDASAGEWHECQKAKLREIQLQKNVDNPKATKHKKHRRSEDRHQSAEEIATWLWKNCREYSYELRELEQNKM